MTEEDTFNALRRVPLQEMFDLWLGATHLSGIISSSTRPMVEEFFNRYGWSYEEYYAARKKNNV